MKEVTKAAGPYPEATISAEADGMTFPGLTVEGRTSRTGALDDLTLNGGRWPTRPGQIALAVYAPVRASIGSKITITSLPGKPRLTVVGYAGSVVRDEDAWVVPSEITALRKAGAAPSEEMLYDFTSAGSGPQITADVSALKAVLPAGAVSGYVSWLSSTDQTGSEQGINTPFVVAFAIMALVLSVLIVANVVSGAVVAGYRRIGVSEHRVHASPGGRRVRGPGGSAHAGQAVRAARFSGITGWRRSWANQEGCSGSASGSSRCGSTWRCRWDCARSSGCPLSCRRCAQGG